MSGGVGGEGTGHPVLPYPDFRDLEIGGDNKSDNTLSLDNDKMRLKLAN